MLCVLFGRFTLPTFSEFPSIHESWKLPWSGASHQLMFLSGWQHGVEAQAKSYSWHSSEYDQKPVVPEKHTCREKSVSEGMDIWRGEQQGV